MIDAVNTLPYRPAMRMVVTALLLFALPASAEDHPCEGLETTEITLEGCTGFWCDAPAEREKLFSLMGLAAAEKWEESRVNQAQARLEQTQFFRATEAHCQFMDDTRVRVLIRVFPNRWIQRIEIEGNQTLFDSDLKKRMFLRPGVAFSPDDEVGQSERRRQEDVLRRRYQKEGFEDAQIRIQTEKIGSDGVNLVVHVVEGRKRKISGVDVTILQPIEGQRYSSNEAAPAPRAAGPESPEDFDNMTEEELDAVFDEEAEPQPRSEGSDPTAEATAPPTPPETDSQTQAEEESEREAEAQREGADEEQQASVPSARAIPDTTAFPSFQCPPLSGREIELASELSTGDIFTSRREREARRKLRRFLRGKGIVDPSITLHHNIQTGRVRIAVQYERCYALRLYIRHDAQPGELGYTPLEETDIEEAMTFSDSGVFSFEESDLTRQAIESHFQRQGYLFAAVLLRYRRAERSTELGSVRGVIDYYITLNYRSEIRDISIRGNQQVSNADLVAELETRTYDFFDTGGYLLVEQLFGDLHKIQQLYRNRGFYRFGYPNAPPPHEQVPRVRVTRTRDGERDIYNYTFQDLHFRLHKHRDEGAIYLEIQVVEGTLSRVGAVNLPGVPPSTLAELRTQLSVQPGDAFSPPAIAQDRSRIIQFFQERGHTITQLETTCEATGEDGSKLDECNWRTTLAKTVELTHAIVPGPVIRVGEIFIRGNEHTTLSLIRDPLPNPGDVLNRGQLDEAERAIRSLGVFSNVQVHLVGLDETPIRERTAIVVHVQERPAQFLELAAGMEPLTERAQEVGVPAFGSVITNSVGVTDAVLRGPTQAIPLNIPNLLIFGDITYRHQNFIGRAQELEIPFRYGLSLPEEFKDGAAWESAATRLFELRPTFYEPRLGGNNFALSVGVFGRYDRATRPNDELEIGGTTTLRFTLFDRLRTSATVTASGIQVGTFPSDLADNFDLLPKIDVDFATSLDYLDDPINPTEGFAIGARINYIFANEIIDTSGADMGNFLKVELNAKAAVSIRRAMTLAVFARFATSFSGNEEPLPEFERYLLGGQYGLRGLEDGQVHVMDNEGHPIDFLGGNTLVNGTIEFRVPLLRRGWGGLWLGFFLDWGGLAVRLSDFNAESMRVTAGFGARLHVGNIPIRFDLGFNLDRRCNPPVDGLSVVDATNRCTNGREGLTDTQVALLYSF